MPLVSRFASLCPKWRWRRFTLLLCTAGNVAAGGKVGVSGQVLNPENRNFFLAASLIQEAITSSQLEGAVTTRKVAAKMIRTGRKPRDLSERMILNNYRTCGGFAISRT